MGSVICVTLLKLDRLVAVLVGIGYEVYTVNIVDITIIIIVNTRYTILLSGIHPHIIFKIWVAILNHTVYDCHNNAWVAGCNIPSLVKVDICTSLST